MGFAFVLYRILGANLCKMLETMAVFGVSTSLVSWSGGKGLEKSGKKLSAELRPAPHILSSGCRFEAIEVAQ